jgi:hypothetical protein
VTLNAFGHLGDFKNPPNIMVNEQLLSIQNVLKCFGSTVPRTVLHAVKEMSPAVEESLRYFFI